MLEESVHRPQGPGGDARGLVEPAPTVGVDHDLGAVDDEGISVQGSVVFVDGCFLHGCEVHARGTKSSTYWWAEKIAAHQAIDGAARSLLEVAGWAVERVGEHEDPLQAAQRIQASLAADPALPIAG